MDTNNKLDITLDRAIEILESRGEFERSLQNYEARHDYMQLAEWLKELRQLKEQESCDRYIKEIDHLRKYISKLETQIVESKHCDEREKGKCPYYAE